MVLFVWNQLSLCEEDKMIVFTVLHFLADCETNRIGYLWNYLQNFFIGTSYKCALEKQKYFDVIPRFSKKKSFLKIDNLVAIMNTSVF